VSVLINAADLAHIQSTYPLLNIKPLTPQQERFLLLILRGMNVRAAERGAGYAEGSGSALLNQPHVEKILDYYREHEFKDIRVTRDGLTQLLFEAHAKAGCATEEIMAIKEIGKMHDLYEGDKHKGIKIQQNTLNMNGKQVVTNTKQVERLSESELLQLCAFESLEPVPVSREAPRFEDAEDAVLISNE